MLLPGILMTLAAAQAAGASGVVRDGARVCTAVAIVSPDTPRAKGRFSAGTILDLEFRTLVSRKVDGTHRLRFRVYTPKGHLYQELSVPFVANAAGRTLVAARLPVGGTSITTSSLYGKWRVEPHLDDSLKPCVAATRFTIKK